MLKSWLHWMNLRAIFSWFSNNSSNVHIKILFREWELFQVLLSWLRSFQHTLCLFNSLMKAQRLFKTTADWESSSQHEFFSFHCRLELQALEGRNQVIQSLSCKRIWTVNKFRLSFYLEVLDLQWTRVTLSQKGMTVELFYRILY